MEELIYSHLLSLAHKGLQQCIRYVSASAILGLISPYCIINSIKAGLCSLLSIRKAHPQVYAVAIKGCSWSDCWTESSIVSRLRQRGSDRLSTAPQTSRVESDGVVCIADKGSTLSPPSQPLTGVLSEAAARNGPLRVWSPEGYHLSKFRQMDREFATSVTNLRVHCNVDLGLTGQLIAAFKRGRDRQWADTCSTSRAQRLEVTTCPICSEKASNFEALPSLG